MKKALSLAALLLSATAIAAPKIYTLTSPDKSLKVEVSVGEEIEYSVEDNGVTLLKNSKISLDIKGIGDIGENAKVKREKNFSVTEGITSPFYRVPAFPVSYNAMTLTLKSGVAIEWRAYDNGVAYRYLTTKKNQEYVINDETAEFNFTADHTAYVPYTTNPKKQDAMAFQATYDVAPLSQAKDLLAFSPLTVDCGSAKVTIMESNLEAYPGMFLEAEELGFEAEFSKYPKTTDFYPWRMQQYVTSTENYIAKFTGARSLPWRIIAVSHSDKEMLDNHLVYALADNNRIGDTSWIKPGKVAWDWWNDWGISGVDFKAGINMQTYKHYIDFAAKNNLEYIILDEGWYNPKSGDMLTTIPEINLPELVAYGKQKNVGIVLWTVFNVLDKELEKTCKTYADMGIKGFKVDFLDRSDQTGVEMVYRICETCAKHRLFLDLHGIYAPTGINRTYPNVLNFEGVFGMEEAKWSKPEVDMPLYDVTFPFIRMQAGFVDFTPGGFRNASKKDFQPIYNNPLTMGTRCHQMAMYVLHESPFTMLADNPTIYEKEQECTDFIAGIPTVYDEWKAVDGKIGEYVIIARRKGDTWYVAGQTNWDARTVTVNLSDIIGSGASCTVESMTDGVNADKAATDYIHTTKQINAADPLTIQMASGGGFVLKVRK